MFAFFAAVRHGVQKVMVCDLWLVDFDPFFVFQGSLLVIVIMIDSSKNAIVTAAF